MGNKNLLNPVNPVKKLKGKSILNPLPMKDMMHVREGVGVNQYAPGSTFFIK